MKQNDKEKETIKDKNQENIIVYLSLEAGVRFSIMVRCRFETELQDVRLELTIEIDKLRSI